MNVSIIDLPYDILYIVFALCWDKKYDRSLRKPHFPTIVSHVCQNWREHAINTPSFWAILHFQDSRLKLEKYQTWLERSKDAPLDIVLTGRQFDQQSVKTIKEIMQLIVPCSDRWRSLRMLVVPDKIIRVLFNRLLDIPVPALMELEVTGDYHRSFKHVPSATKWRFRPFLRGGAPNLQSIVIDSLSCEYVDARFTSLRVLDVYDIETGNEMAAAVALKVHHILARLPHLQILRLRSTSYYYSPQTDQVGTLTLGSYITPPLLHHALKELSIQASPHIKNVVISSLILPEVQYFMGRTRPARDQWELTLGLCTLPVLKANSPFPNLISLLLGGSDVQITSRTQDPRNSACLSCLQGALDSMKMLESLTFDIVDWEDGQYLHCLSKVCPRLRWLAFCYCEGYTLVDLRSIIEERKTLSGADRLLRLSVHGILRGWKEPPEMDAMEWLAGEVELTLNPDPRGDEPRVDYISSVSAFS